MNIAILNTYEQTGGAAKAAHRLYQGLNLLEQNTNYFVRTKDNHTDKNVIRMDAFNKSMFYMDKLMQKYYSTLNRTAVSNTVFSITYAGVNTALSEELKSPDVINLHWIEKYLSLNSIRQLIELKKPIVWTLHDEKPFTGGCHYTAGCEEFKGSCTNCFQLKYDPYHLAKKVLEAKYDLIKDADISIVTPSKWLAEQAKSSTLFKNKRVEVIPNGIDTQTYMPLDKEKCKTELEIDPSSVVLQFGAQNNSEIRKGFTYLIDAMNICLKNSKFAKLSKEGKIIILCVGEPSREIEELSIQTKSVGYIDNDADMLRLYNATDVFILPSLEDNLPNTMLESMACKTPVIGFDTGGIPDVVNSENGRVVEKGNASKLAEAIIELTLDDNLRADLGIEGHTLINSKYTIEIQAKNYLKFFEDIQKNKATDKIKKNETDLNSCFDAVVGYALQSEAKQNNYLFDKQEKTSLNPVKTDKHSELFRSLEEISKVRMMKNPIKKIKAYRKTLSIFQQYKK